jgi:serine protease Do
MNANKRVAAAGIVIMGVALAAFPAASDTPQNVKSSAAPTCPDAASLAQLEKRLAELETRLQEEIGPQLQERLSDSRKVLEDKMRSLSAREALQNLKIRQVPETRDLTVLLGDERGSWLGVETQEVTAEKAKALKLPAERGVIIAGVTPDSPAAKAGLHENDVITEIDGQQVEGTAQFRRMIREIPAGRTAQLRIFRNGAAQTLQATLGKAEQGAKTWAETTPGAFEFHMPDMPEIPPIPPMDWSADLLPGHARLGIEAEDLNGQLGAYFGAPDGEGILVHGVDQASPAEKAGLRAGDVITAVNGKRVRTIGDLREQIAATHEAKTVQLSLLRNKAPLTVTVELPAPAVKKHVGTFGYRTTI